MGNYDDNDLNSLPRIRRNIRPVKAVQRISPVQKRRDYQEQKRARKEMREELKLRDETLRHFRELELEVKALQERLIEENRPLRVQIHRKDTSVFIDIFRIDSSGKETKIATRDITHADFTDWAKQIQEGEGMMFNVEG